MNSKTYYRVFSTLALLLCLAMGPAASECFAGGTIRIAHEGKHANKVTKRAYLEFAYKYFSVMAQAHAKKKLLVTKVKLLKIGQKEIGKGYEAKLILEYRFVDPKSIKSLELSSQQVLAENLDTYLDLSAQLFDRTQDEALTVLAEAMVEHASNDVSESGKSVSLLGVL